MVYNLVNHSLMFVAVVDAREQGQNEVVFSQNSVAEIRIVNLYRIVGNNERKLTATTPITLDVLSKFVTGNLGS
jgi:hypothetical protein